LLLWSCHQKEEINQSNGDISFLNLTEHFSPKASIQTGDVIYVAGTSYGSPALLKMNTKGELVSFKVIEGYSGSLIHDMISIRSGGFLIIGGTQSRSKVFPPVNIKAMVLKIDYEGNIIWDNLVNISNFQNQWYSVVEDLDGNFVLAGKTLSAKTNQQSPSTAMISKIGASGNTIVLEEKDFGTFSFFGSVTQSPDGSYIFSGVRANDWDFNIIEIIPFVSKLEANSLNPEWTKDLGNGTLQRRPIYKRQGGLIFSLEEGGYVVARKYLNDTLSHSMSVTKLDKDGNSLREDVYPVLGYSRLHSFKPIEKGYMLFGTSSPTYNEFKTGQSCAIKLDKNGNHEWTFSNGSMNQSQHTIGIGSRAENFGITGQVYGELSSNALYYFELTKHGKLVDR
jgi:hypothetical protein